MAMTSSVITLIGLQRALDIDGKSVFDSLTLPSGIDKSTLIDSIILKAGTFELLYSDPDMLTYSIGAWGKKYYDTFDKWNIALSTTYNPLENYDRIEDSTIEHEGNYTKGVEGETSGENTRTDDLTMENDLTETHNLESTNDVTTSDSKAAFNSGTYDPLTQQIVDQDGSDTGDITNTGTVTNKGTVKNEYSDTAKNNESGEDAHKDTTSSRIHGNIGVTTSQQMLESEITLREKYNIFELITDLFIQEFCIMTY